MATTTEQKPETGLQRSAPAGITTAADYERQLATWQQERAHVLSPAVAFSGLPAQHALMASKVKLNPDPAAGDVYQDNLFTKGNDVAIAKIGLSKIAQCAGISIETARTDTRTVPCYWEVQATARWVGFDGMPQSCQATVEYDLRDGSPRLKGFTANQIEQARKHGLAGAETRAINRAIRQFGVKQKYTKAELEKPFVVVRVTFQPDMTDPVTRAVVTQQRLQGANAMYPGAAALPPLPPASEPIDAEVVSSTPSRPAAASQPAAAASMPADFEDLPAAAADAAEPHYVITSVKRQPNGNGFRYFVTTDRTLDELLETSEDLAMAAAQAKKDGKRVELTIERTAKGPLIAELRLDLKAPATELPPDARFVVDVKEKSGKTNDKPWTRYTVVFKDGTEATTFSDSLAKLAYEAKARGDQAPVRASFSVNEKYPDQQNLDSLDIIDTRQGTLPLAKDL